MMRLNLKSLLILMPLFSLTSRASVIEFTDRTAWLAAAGAVIKCPVHRRYLHRHLFEWTLAPRLLFPSPVLSHCVELELLRCR